MLKAFMQKMDMPLTLSDLGVPATDENLQKLEDYLLTTPHAAKDEAGRALLHEAIQELR